MHDKYVSRLAVVTALLWTVAVLLVLATWVTAALLEHRWQAAIGVTSVLFMASASVCQIRLYVLRVCGLIRVSAGLESPDAEVRPFARV